MCFVGSVRRLSDGRLVEERPHQQPNPPKPIPTASVPTNTAASTNIIAATAKKTYSDPFAGLQSSPPSSPPSSSGQNNTKKQPVGPCKPRSPSQLTDDVEQRDKEQKKAEPAAKQAAFASFPTHVKKPKTTTHPQSPSQPAPPNLTKKVSFPDSLTRGRGTSYSPPGNDKAVRFSTSLVRGEGSDYSDRDIDRDKSVALSHGLRVSPQQRPKSTIGHSTSNQQVNENTMEISEESEHQADVMDIDIRSESDQSFTDLVDVINVVKTESEPQQRRSGPGYDPRSNRDFGHRHITDTPTWNKPLETMRAKLSDSDGGFIAGSGDDQSYPAHSRTPHKRRSSLPRRDTIFGTYESSIRKGTPIAPTYNCRGHRLRSNPSDNNLLGYSLHRSWPEPIFVWKDRTRTPVLGHPDPAFALREKSDSQNNVQSSGRSVSTKSSRQQSKRKYQSPSVIDDTVNKASHYNPIRKKTYHDI
ncbi:MAG: hypothetical protein Q9209_004637 [Squamulea sp. 1 TL-2023]